MSSPQTWQVVIQKQLGTEFWVNDYHVQANSPTDAQIKGLQIVELEKAISRSNVAFVSMRVRIEPSTGQGTVYPLSGVGSLGLEAYLPLYNTIRVDMGPEFGRPGRKYLRQPIGQTSSVNGNLSPGMITLVNDAYSTPLVNLGFVCKPNGQLFVTAGVKSAIQMRQLRRGARKRDQPVIPLS